MATYLPGVQDQIERVRPPQPNLQFESQLLSARQSKYDQGHKQLSDMYGKILNAGLTRESNVEARDDFFKLIDGDLRKIAGIDLSKQSNVTKAQNVFSQVYENDYLVKDMVWTKNYQNQLQRAEEFKNCVDPEECGGSYWDGGMKYMQYKKQEFAETDNADSLGFQNAEFVPYQNIMAKAMVAAKDAGLSITQEDIMGDYKVTTKNGRLLVTPLTELFDKLYADNPGYQKQFEVESYNQRKDVATQMVQSGEYATMQEAEVGYITKQSEALTAAVDRVAVQIGADNETIDRELEALTKKKDSGLMHQGDASHIKYMELLELKKMSNQAKGFAKISQTALKNANNHGVIRNIGHQLDQASGLIRLDAEINGIAKTLSNRDSERLLELDEKAKMRIAHGYSVSLEGVKQAGRMQLEGLKQDGRMELAEFKGEGGSPMSIAHTINKQFGGAFGAKGEQAMAEITAEADKKFDYYSSTDLSKLGKNPTDTKRVKAMAHNESVKTARAKWITEQQAKLLDEKGGTTWGGVLKENPDYNTILGTPGGRVTAGGGNSGGGNGGAGGSAGGGNEGLSGAGAAAVSGANKVKPLPTRDTDDNDYTTVDFTKVKPAQVNEMMAMIAEGHADPGKKKFYTRMAETGYENLSKEDKALVNKSLGTRINQTLASAKGYEESLWTKTTGTKSDGDAGEGKAEKHFKKNDQAALKNKQALSQKFTTEYLKTLDVSSDEYKALQQQVHKYLIDNGGSTTNGALEFTDSHGETHSIGQLYRDYNEGGSNMFRSAVPLNGGALRGKGLGDYPESSTKRLRGLYLKNVEADLTKEVMTKIIGGSNYLADNVYKTTIRNKTEGYNDYFDSKVYKNSAKDYDNQNEIYAGYTESKKEHKSDLEKAMRIEMKDSEHFKQFIWEEGTSDAGKQVYSSKDFIDENGRFKVDHTSMSTSTINMGRKLYANAMDAVFKENGYSGKEAYMPGIGSRLSTTFAAFDPDMLDVKDQGTVSHIRDYLNVMKASDVTGSMTGVFRKQNLAYGKVEYMGVGTNDQKNEIINSILNGELDISSIEFNAIGGKANPIGGKESNLSDSDWQTMRVAVKGGEVYEFDMNTNIHKTKLLEIAHNGNGKAQMLSDVGRYTYRKGDNLTPSGIKVSLDGDGVALTGQIYSWDAINDQKVYKDINDYISNDFLQYNTPEVVEYEIDRIINAISDPYYKEHNPIVK